MKRGRKPKCPYCGSNKTCSKGTRKTTTLGKRPLRYCNNCKRKFTVGLAKKKPAATAKDSKQADAAPHT